jgi:hypothetical protein
MIKIPFEYTDLESGDEKIKVTIDDINLTFVIRKPLRSDIYFLDCYDEDEVYYCSNVIVTLFEDLFRGNEHKIALDGKLMCFPLSITGATKNLEYGDLGDTVEMYYVTDDDFDF